MQFNPIGAAMTRLIRRSALVICLLAVASQASAEVVLLSQSRSVSGDGTLGERSGWFGNDYTLIASDDITISAPAFGLFEEEISIDLTSNNLVSVTQDSEIQTGHFSIHGSAAVTAFLWPPSCDFQVPCRWSEHDSRANSHFEVLFEVSTPTSFNLAGSLTSTFTGPDWSYYKSPIEHQQIASLQLDRDGVPYLSFSAALNVPFEPPREEIAVVSEFGILEPGTYTLTVYASTHFFLSGPEEYSTASIFSSFDIIFDLGSPIPVQETTWGQIKALYN
jgi:hypothetical protein